MDLRGKVAILTGGKRLGLYIAEALAKRGASIVMTYLHSKKIIENEIQNLKKYGIGAYAVKADLSRQQDVKKLFQFVIKKFGRLDILIHMASTFQKIPWKKLNEKNFNFEIGNNLKSAFLCSKAAADIMLKQKSGGKIILFGDIKVEKPYAGRLPYLTAKAGVHMLAKILKKELPRKIPVHLVAPGYIHLSKRPPNKRIQKLYRRVETPEKIIKKVLPYL